MRSCQGLVADLIGTGARLAAIKPTNEMPTIVKKIRPDVISPLLGRQAKHYESYNVRTSKAKSIGTQGAA
jgi:hypothetical protein